eukprot:c19521_g1_i1.p1 GENE.c19521_g1_i1~~c19521_g1_i1.p1  ORF type:complete len:171 (+),score=28.26 c19521_g1_i1:299-811(+)
MRANISSENIRSISQAIDVECVPSINETLAFHSGPALHVLRSAVLGIMRRNHDARDAYGIGITFCDDALRADCIGKPEEFSKPVEESELIERLGVKRSSEKTRFMLLCRIILGCSANGLWSMVPSRASLKSIGSTRVCYHSMTVDTGDGRDFVIFEPRYVLPVLLIEYTI